MGVLLVLPFILAVAGCVAALIVAGSRRAPRNARPTAAGPFVPETRRQVEPITNDEMIDLHLALNGLVDLRSAMGVRGNHQRYADAAGFDSRSPTRLGS